MEPLEGAMRELDRARAGDDVPTDVRTQIESIGASLEEMLDTEAGERTDAEDVFGEVDVAGAAPNADNLEELEATLDGLADDVGGGTRDHLDAARRRIAAYRERERE